MLSGQFGYATTDRPGPYSDVVGWKVVEVRPPELAGPLSARIAAATAQLGGFRPEPLPLLGTDAEIAALPRRLRLTASGDRAVLVLQSPAGQSHQHEDAFFGHGLLVRLPTPGEPATGAGRTGPRPAELWDSPLWCRPVGADQVAAVTLPDLPVHLDLPAGRVTSPTRLWRDHRRTAALIMAVLEQGLTRRGGVSRVALLDPDGSTTADWAAFVQAHLTVGAAWSAVPFSTRESPAPATIWARSGLRIIGLAPDTDPAAAARSLGPEWLLLDPAAPPPPDRAGTGWTLPDGRHVPLGPWAALTGRLTLLGEGMTELSSLVDAVSTEAMGSADDRPLWALPAAVLAAVDDTPAPMVPALRQAVALANRNWPTRLVLAAPMLERIRSGLDTFGEARSDTDLWITRRSPAPGGPDLRTHPVRLSGVDSNGSAPNRAGHVRRAR